MSVVFLCVNVVCAALGERDEAGDKAWRVVLVRVLVNDLLFIVEAICLAVSLLLLTRLSPSTSLYLHSKVVHTPDCTLTIHWETPPHARACSLPRC